MSRRVVWVVMLVVGVVFSVRAGGEAEAASSSARGAYLAARGMIVSPEEVHVDSYVASIDYSYPNPEGTIGVTVVSGNRQLSMRGQE